MISFIHDYLKRKTFYNYVRKKFNELDYKFLITELIKTPDFLEGNILVDYLYEINKTFIEDLNKYKYSSEEFKEYIELWCHEIKTPIATLKLIIENDKNKLSSNVIEEVNRIENYVEQVLFYARSGNLEKDYIITKVNLKTTVDDIIKKNKKDIINKHIKIKTFKEDVYIESDTKWLEFIINQIVVNSIKYSKEVNAKINFDCQINKNSVMLFIEDNGIGIKSEEINKVFDKGFTGSNGRKKYNSTGIGLYLCKNLCNKLAHNISISSKENEFAKVTIVFPEGSLTKEVK